MHIGESLSINISFNPEYDKSRIQDLILHIGKFNVGSLSEGEIVVDGEQYRCAIKSEKTALFEAKKEAEITLTIDDSQSGIIKEIVGTIDVLRSNSNFKNDSVNTGTDIVITCNILDTVQTITAAIMAVDLSDLNNLISTAAQTALNLKANISGQVFTGNISATNLSNTNTGDETKSSIESKLTGDITSHNHDNRYYTETESDIRFEPKNNNIQEHIVDTSNPHNVTKQQVGLSNVDNTSDLNKPISTATQLALDIEIENRQQAISSLNNSLQIEVNARIAEDLNLNTIKANLSGATFTGNIFSTNLSGTNTGDETNLSIKTKLGTDLSNKLDYNGNGSSLIGLTKTQVGLSNVDNTSDINKPISTATQTALNTKLDKTGGTISGDLTITGNIYQNGASYETHAEQVYTKDNTIILRDGAVSALGVGEYAGFTASKYDGVNDGQLVFDNNGVAKVGDVGNLQNIATIESSPIDLGDVYWDNTTKQLKTKVSDISSLVSKTITQTVTILAADWSASVNANGFYYATITNPVIVTTDWIESVFANSESASVISAEIQPSLTVNAGSFIIETKNKPSVSLHLTYKITGGL